MDREIKDSGIEWIGNVPKEWRIVPNKHVMQKKKLICDKYNNENVLSLTMNGVIIRDLQNPTGKMPATFDGYQFVSKGNLLMCLFDIDVTPRCVGLINDNGITSPAYSQFVMKDNIDANYYYYYYLNLDFSKELLHLSKNMRNSLTESQLGEMKVPLPPLHEQQAIANYLDKKVGKIDELIAEQKTAIEKWKSYKQSLIAETVTKGLNPNVEMKDSEIEWIGEIPTDWECKKLKRTLISRKEAVRVGPFGSQLKGNDFRDSGHPVYNQKVVLTDEFNKFESFISDEKFKELECFSVKAGDVLVTTRGSIGKVAIVPEEFIPGVIHPCIIKLQFDEKKIYVDYIRYIFNNTIVATEQLKKMSSSTIIDVVYSEPLKNIYLPIPNVETQLKIINFLDEKCLKIEQIIEQKQALIKQLEEYKQSLIYECVTGKRCVKER